MKENADVVRGWLRKAASNMVTVEAAARAGSFDAACFHAQVPVVWLMALLTIAATIVPKSVMAQAKKPPLPYVTIDHPQFVSASRASFLSPHDLLIGVTDGKTAKAYPAAILAQHGVVQDQTADGPIAVTW
jgi:hypothetical protein